MPILLLVICQLAISLLVLALSTRLEYSKSISLISSFLDNVKVDSARLCLNNSLISRLTTAFCLIYSSLWNVKIVSIVIIECLTENYSDSLRWLCITMHYLVLFSLFPMFLGISVRLNLEVLPLIKKVVFKSTCAYIRMTPHYFKLEKNNVGYRISYKMKNKATAVFRRRA